MKLYIELTNNCNLACSICPNKSMKRPKGYMDPDLYFALIEQARGRFESVNFSYFGEPLIHPNIRSFMQALKDRDFQVFMNTNAYYLDGPIGKVLAAIKVDQLRLSIDTFHFSAYMPIVAGSMPWVSAINNARKFLKIKDRGSVRIVRVENNINVDMRDDYIRSWISFIRPGDEILVKGPISWQGAIDIQGHGRQGPCEMWDGETVVVAWDGTVSPCYLDYEQELAIGKWARHFDLSRLSQDLNFRKMKSTTPDVCRRCSDKNYDIVRVSG